MRTQITILIHPSIYLIPKGNISIKGYDDDRKEILFRWLFFTIEMVLVKRNHKSWIKQNIEQDEQTTN